jgi:hypothetical protein
MPSCAPPSLRPVKSECDQSAAQHKQTCRQEQAAGVMLAVDLFHVAIVGDTCAQEHGDGGKQKHNAYQRAYPSQPAYMARFPALFTISKHVTTLRTKVSD